MGGFLYGATELGNATSESLTTYTPILITVIFAVIIIGAILGIKKYVKM